MSQESAVAQNPLVSDSAEEMKRLEKEAEAVKNLQGDSFDIPNNVKVMA